MTDGDHDVNRSTQASPDLSTPVARAVEALREPVTVSPGFEENVMRRVRAGEVGVLRWLALPAWWHLPMGIEMRTASMPRARPLALAAGLTALAAALTFVLLRFATSPRGLPQVQFVLAAPGAHSVAVLGDFNHWTATPLKLVRRRSGTWATTVRVAPGRHVYSFLIDGTRWVADPGAPRSLDDDFGRPSAVVTVAGHST